MGWAIGRRLYESFELVHDFGETVQRGLGAEYFAVRRSTASTSVSRAGTSGLPARSIRRNTIPCPAGAGRNVASVVAPVWSPVPRSAALRVTERLVVGGGSGALRRSLGF